MNASEFITCFSLVKLAFELIFYDKFAITYRLKYR